MLTEAIDKVDLKELVLHHFPQAEAGDKLLAIWRGEKTASCQVSKSPRGGEILTDFGASESYNAYHFLTQIVELEPHEAIKEIYERAGMELSRRFDLSPATPKTSNYLQDCQNKLLDTIDKPPLTLRGRGFVEADLRRYGLGRDGEDAIIPIYDEAGVLRNVTKRQASSMPKYILLEKGKIAVPWHSYNIMQKEIILLCEGQLNAMVAHSVMGGGIGLVGINGVNTMDATSDFVFRQRKVYIYLDGDMAGQKALDDWAKKALNAGATSVYLFPPNSKDFCDMARDSRTGLKNYITENLANLQPSYGQMDRVVTGSGQTVRELANLGQQFVEGKILVPTGFTELDHYTLGLPESGLILTAGLSSMGKSRLMYDIVLYLMMKHGYKFIGFSPDQSPFSTFKQMASVLSGIPSWRVNRKRFTSEQLDTYGSEDKIISRWKDAYADVVLQKSKSLVLFEELDLNHMDKNVEEAKLSMGINGVLIDYVQMLPHDRNGGEAGSARRLKELASKWRLPVIAATQLAKYKFPMDTRDGIPYVTDIEGSGAWQHAANIILGIYRMDKYFNDYTTGIPNERGEPKVVPPQHAEYDAKGYSRLYVLKNKDGDASGAFRYVKWDDDFHRFKNIPMKEYPRHVHTDRDWVEFRRPQIERELMK